MLFAAIHQRKNYNSGQAPPTQGTMGPAKQVSAANMLASGNPSASLKSKTGPIAAGVVILLLVILAAWYFMMRKGSGGSGRYFY